MITKLNIIAFVRIKAYNKNVKTEILEETPEYLYLILALMVLFQ